MEYGTAAYHIEKAHRHLDNFEGQLRAIPDDADPDEIEELGARLGELIERTMRAVEYARVCRQRKVEAEANVDAVIAGSRRAA